MSDEPGRHGIARVTATAVLMAVGLLCMVVAPPTVWASGLILNTDRYVQTVGPVASDRGVQDAVIAAVDKKVGEQLNVAGFVGDVLPGPAARILSPMLQTAATGLVNDVTTEFVRSSAFPALWKSINRTAHRSIVYALTGKGSSQSAVEVGSDGRILLHLAPVVDKVKSALVAAGLTVAKLLPVVDATIEVARLEGLDSARRIVRVLDSVAMWLPWLGLGLLAGAVVLSRRKRRAVTGAALGVCAGMLLLGLGLLIGRTVYLGAVPVAQLPHDTASFLFDTAVRYLRLGVRLILLVALLVASAAWLSGPSAVRTALVAASRRQGERLAGGLVGDVLAKQVWAVRATIVAVPGLIVLIVNDTSTTFDVVLVTLAVLALLTVELVRRGQRRGAPPPAANRA